MIDNPATIGPGGADPEPAGRTWVHGVRADGGGKIFRTFVDPNEPRPPRAPRLGDRGTAAVNIEQYGRSCDRQKAQGK